MDLLVFLLSTPTRLGGFSSINLVSSSLYPLGLGAWYSGFWFFLFTFLSNRQKVFSPILQNKYQTMLMNYALNGARVLKGGNCNIVAIWSHHMISFVIIQRYSTKSTSTYHLLPNTPNLIYLLWDMHQPCCPPCNCWALKLQ